MGSYMIEADKNEFEPKKWASDNPNGFPKRSMETHLNVLVVGGGLAGLMTALECWRKGHNVISILERQNGPVYTGDIIIIGPSATNIFRHWPDMWRELDENREESVVYYRKHNGELILGPTSLGFNNPEYIAERKGFPIPAPHQVRSEFYQMLLRQVARVGLKVEYGQRVERYFEDDAAAVGGVVTQDGSIRVADIVVAADAGKTSSELLISGQPMPSQSSGMSVYRTAIPTELALKNDAFRNRWGEMKETSHEFWIGPGMHLGLMVSPTFVAWGLTPRDNFIKSGGVEPIGSWDPKVDPEDVMQVLHRVPGWDPAIEGLMSVTPKGAVVHWPLLWRNLRREWTSKAGASCKLVMQRIAPSQLQQAAVRWH